MLNEPIETLGLSAEQERSSPQPSMARLTLTGVTMCFSIELHCTGLPNIRIRELLKL